ncbi:MAG: WcbI family polysaccharide biosynthesis putative acetyltransferase, partial [Candidatus Diapherotrites archaeon]|nr:WcbI family polysaccharide biosynthesis putative acetyltransferase [Candidatus Diapherotrites archaeon]
MGISKPLILIYANCQGTHIKDKLNSAFGSKYDFAEVKKVHLMGPEDLDELYRLLPTVDVIIYQSVNDNYVSNTGCKDPRFETKSVLKQVKTNCVKIWFPVLYFMGYSQDKFIHEKSLAFGEFCSHDPEIIRTFLKSNSEISFMNNISKLLNLDYYSEEYLLNRAFSSVEELRKRERQAIEIYSG